MTHHAISFMIPHCARNFTESDDQSREKGTNDHQKLCGKNLNVIYTKWCFCGSNFRIGEVEMKTETVFLLWAAVRKIRKSSTMTSWTDDGVWSVRQFLMCLAHEARAHKTVVASNRGVHIGMKLMTPWHWININLGTEECWFFNNRVSCCENRRWNLSVFYFQEHTEANGKTLEEQSGKRVLLRRKHYLAHRWGPI